MVLAAGVVCGCCCVDFVLRGVVCGVESGWEEGLICIALFCCGGHLVLVEGGEVH